MNARSARITLTSPPRAGKKSAITERFQPMKRTDSDLQGIIERLRNVTHGGHVPSILVVDDSNEDLVLCQEDIKELRPDIAIDAVNSGRAALEKLATGRYDFAIIDLNMPEMTGIQVIETAVRRGVNIPLIAMSGFDNGPVVNEAIKRGAGVHVRKSHFKEDLGRLISWLRPA